MRTPGVLGLQLLHRLGCICLISCCVLSKLASLSPRHTQTACSFQTPLQIVSQLHLSELCDSIYDSVAVSQRRAWASPGATSQRSVLQALEELLVADNKLEGVPEGLFQALRNLRTVVLYGNALRGLPAGPFLSPNLKGDPSGPSDPKADSSGMLT